MTIPVIHNNNDSIMLSAQIEKAIANLGRGKYSVHQVFSDFVELMALALSQPLDFREDREERYHQIRLTYTKEEFLVFPEIMAKFVRAMQDDVEKGNLHDLLGPIFHSLESHSARAGQFFTPYQISDLMSELTDFDDSKPFERVAEFCTGSGTMILSRAKMLLAKGINPSARMVVYAKDIDLRCVHMSYIQFALAGIPAEVVHGNGLSEEELDVWRTPIYQLHRWQQRLASDRSTISRPSAQVNVLL